MLGGSHQPSARAIGHAVPRPLLERRHQSVLRQLFRQANVAHDAAEARDEPRRFDTKDRVDRGVRG
jgi:hypothetical protein